MAAVAPSRLPHIVGKVAFVDVAKSGQAAVAFGDDRKRDPARSLLRFQFPHVDYRCSRVEHNLRFTTVWMGMDEKPKLSGLERVHVISLVPRIGQKHLPSTYCPAPPPSR